MALENVHLVWLDPLSTNYQSSLSLFQQLLHSISHCSNLNEFHQLIESEIDVNFIVILSDSFDDSIFVEFDSIDSIYSIYFLSNRTIHSKKLQQTLTNIESIFDFIRRDLRQIQHDNQTFEIFSLNSIDPIYSSMMLLRDLLIQKPNNEQTRQTFIDFVRREYFNDSIQMNLIDEYSQCLDYQNVALQWFTRECFLSSLVQRALRSKNANLLDQIAFFIGDLHRQIERIHQNTSIDERLIVYYGRGVEKQVLDELQIYSDRLFFFDTFLLTSIDRNLSEYHAQQSAEREKQIPVLFQLNIDRTRSSFPFTRLNSIDFYHDTDQYVLFSFYSTFRFQSIQFLENNIYQITLTLIDPIVQLDSKTNRFFPLIKMMFDQKDFRRAKIFGQIELKQMTNENRQELAKIHHYLGRIDQKIDRFVDALNHFEQSLRIRLESLPMNNRSIALEYFAVASMLFKLNRFDQSNQFYQRTIEFAEKNSSYDNSTIAKFYFGLGKSFLRLKENSRAKTAFQTAFRYVEKSSLLNPSNSSLIDEIKYYLISID